MQSASPAPATPKAFKTAPESLAQPLSNLKRPREGNARATKVNFSFNFARSASNRQPHSGAFFMAFIAASA
jgi:hypothetical protein